MSNNKEVSRRTRLEAWTFVIETMGRIRASALKFIEWSLYGHGVLHFVELGFALYEEAYITASLAGFGAMTMILGAVFLGRDHHHHAPTPATT